MTALWMVDYVQHPSLRKTVLMTLILLIFTVVNFRLHPEEVKRSMGDCSVFRTFLYALNTTTGIGGFWQPTTFNARATAVLQNSLFLLLIMA
jgi:hypothetical protein